MMSDKSSLKNHKNPRVKYPKKGEKRQTKSRCWTAKSSMINPQIKKWRRVRNKSFKNWSTNQLEKVEDRLWLIESRKIRNRRSLKKS